jgi:ferredoxin-fold anticodon binding domain-containing protein
MNIQEINRSIISGKWSNDELTSMIDAVKFARSRLAQTLKFSLRVGQKVQFTSSRSGMTLVGTVRKVAIKNVIVDTPQGGYKVPANMLEAV